MYRPIYRPGNTKAAWGHPARAAA